ncbi:flagellar filament capping protein FliD [Aeoliella sp. ICT_H6.2]|uniref:Filament cap protein n=1 Tax=Aeoliella straminimaris TaxID=2954799 RepID=A0A9X2F8U9_9BACT|nr:flagellar filament capping protein FliD [Aeoliella straminimaris]MCO6043778.1 flagellar filament capping protein FliD [Aeoliella straminimaris]
MGQFQSSVGLITGIPIKDTVDQLMQIAATPRDTLQERTDALTAERTALEQVTSLLLGMRFSAGSLNASSLYTATKATSSNQNLMTVATKTNPPPQPGTYTFTPLQTATNHQVVSSAFTDVANQLSSGTFRIGAGGHVDRGIRLSELNSGDGFAAGKIRITDRSGASAEVDLRTALTVDDVLEAINSNSDIDVTASVAGDSFVLTDNTGGAGNLRVKEVGLGSAAASLGLAEVNVAADSVTGDDVFSLHSGTLLSSLNDGTGVQVHSVGDVLTVTLADESELTIDVSGSTSLGAIINAINAADNTKLSAAISADGNRLELTDLTSGSGAFGVTSTGTVAEDLGLTSTAVGGVITGKRLISGLRDTLVSSLNGGQGYSELTSIDIVDRAGNPLVNVDLSAAETLSDLVDTINESGANVTAAINGSRNGISITDNSGGTGNLTISSSDTTAAALGIEVDDAVGSVNSGSLNRQVVSESTLLEDFNGGKGVRLGDFRITDSAGNRAAVSLDSSNAEAETIGDVIDKINALSVQVEARINDTGDGILITDLAGGSGTLSITDSDGDSAAADLRIATASSDTDDSGQQIIDGRTSFEVDLSTLEIPDSIALSTLNGGSGIQLGTIEVTTGDGTAFFVQLDKPGDEAYTVQDVIDKINDAATAAGTELVASLNNAGNGIQLVDSSLGNETLSVRDLGSGTAAAELRLTNNANKNLTTGIQRINGSGAFTALDEDADALGILVQQINDFDGGFTASTFFDGTGYRLSITSENTGNAAELLVDTSTAGFSTQDATRPRDAVLQYGNSGTGGIVVTSTNNTFDNVVQGLSVTVNRASSDPVTVEVGTDTTKLTNATQNLVDSFNSLRTTLEQLTSFDAASNTTGLLFGRNEVIRVELDLANVLTSAFSSSSEFRTLSTLGIRLNQEGELEFDSARLAEALEENPNEVQKLFTLDGLGVVDKLQAAIDSLAGEENSALTRRYDSLTSTIENNEARIESMTEFLARERERTLLEFYTLEQTISQLQSNIDVIESIQFIAPVNRSSS